MRRVLNVETGNGDAPGYVLDIYESTPATYRAEVRSPEEDVLMVAAGANLDGDAGVIGAIGNFFLGTPNADIGKALVAAARTELAANARSLPREAVTGMQLAGVVMEALSPLRDAWPDIGADALGEVAAKAAVELHKRFRIEERT